MMNCDDDTYDTATTTWTDPLYDVSAGCTAPTAVRDYELGGASVGTTTDDAIYELAGAVKNTDENEI